MKEFIETLVGSFVDYAGKTHKFVIAAVSEAFDEENPLLVAANTALYVETVGSVEKGLRIGISVCHPDDKFDEKVGTLKAVARARNSEIALYATNKGYINSPIVKAFLEQEAEFFKKNPERYIKGYSESKERYLKKKSMEEMKANFSEVERIVLENMDKNPKYLDNVNAYLKWKDNQEKGACKKQKK